MIDRKLFKQVSKAEFDAFIRQYPRKLDKDVCGIFEPPMISWNDFTLAPMWPESVVAYIWPEGYWIKEMSK